MFTYEFPFFLEGFGVSKHLVDFHVVPFAIGTESLHPSVELDIVHVGSHFDLGNDLLTVTKSLRLVVASHAFSGADVAVGDLLLIFGSPSVIDLMEVVVFLCGGNVFDARVSDPPSEHIVDLLLVEDHL